MSLIQFCKSLFIDPIGFVDTYLKAGRVSPEFKEKRDKVIYQLPLVPLGISYITELVPASLIYFSLSIGNTMQAALFVLVHVLGLACLCFVVYLLMYPSYRLSCWCFQKAIHWAGGTLPTSKGRDIQLYTSAFGVLIGFVNIIPSFMLSVSEISGAVKLRLVLGFISSLITIVICIRYLYVKYKIIKKITNAPPFLALCLDLLITLIVCVLLVLGIVAFILGIWFCLLALSV